ncbi:MAG: HDOD domain-containing protein [Thiobacillus sp.]
MMQFERLDSNLQLPSPKGVALAVLALSKREDVTLGEIALTVQTDPALSGRLIRLANSASQISRPVISIQDAVARQGVKAVCQLALGFSLLDQYRDGGCDAFDYPKYWSHSLLMGLTMQALGAHVRVGDPNELFICGLLAQIGQLALATVYPREYSAVLTAYQANPTQALATHERALLKTDHAELGVAMMVDWGLPKTFAQPLALYESHGHLIHSQDSRSNSLILMLHLAHRLADIGLAEADKRPPLTQAWLKLAAQLDIKADAAGNFIHDVVAEWHDWGTLLQIQTEPIPSFSERVRHDWETEEEVLSLRIVVADSNEFTRRKTMALLAEGGNHTVYPVNDGQTALSLILETRPHVIIAHCNLQQLDGLALCQTLREADVGRGIYILLMDDHHNVGHSIRAYANGADGYVTSTINSNTLHSRLVAAQRLARLKATQEQDRAQLNKLAAELDLANKRLANTGPVA